MVRTAVTLFIMTGRKHDSGGSKRPRWLRWSRDIALLVIAVAAVQWWQARDLVAGPAPPLVGHLVDGSPYQLDPAEGPVLVHFWATWCPICRLEQGTIADLSRGNRVITVATTSGSAEELRGYLQQEGLEMPVLMDEDGQIARSWGVGGVPATFIVDSQGRIDHAGMGYSTGLGLRLRLWLAD